MSTAKLLTFAAALIAVGNASAALVRSATGADASAISPTVTDFRNDLGPLNANVAGSFGTGRREINWDGVPAAFSAPNNLPANFFNSNSPRGAVFTTAGAGFQVSGSTGDGTPIEFNNLNASYSSTFGVFSPQRLFTSLGSNVLDVNFFVPGSSTPATVFGFGSVFTDVDLGNTTSIQYFDANGISLGTFFVPATSGSETLSFLGVSAFGGSGIGRVRITNGNTAIGATDTSVNDVVVMDDFIYGEPNAVVPEPGTISLIGAGLLAGLLRLRRA